MSADNICFTKKTILMEIPNKVLANDKKWVPFLKKNIDQIPQSPSLRLEKSLPCVHKACFLWLY